MISFDGQLVIDREPGNEWGYLLVDENIRRKCFDLLCLGDIGFSIPDYEAHISVFDEEEVKLIPNPIPEEGKWCEFVLSDLKVVNPEDWDEVNACIILCVDSKPLEHLRERCGFESLMYGSHQFHITIGISENGINEKVEEIVDLFNQYLKNDLETILSL